MILDPPYDGWAEWHAHFFPPRGESELEYNPPNDKVDARFDPDSFGRYDAVEDRLGRIFVWDVEKGEVVQVCYSREEACRIARGLATI